MNKLTVSLLISVAAAVQSYALTSFDLLSIWSVDEQGPQASVPVNGVSVSVVTQPAGTYTIPGPRRINNNNTVTNINSPSFGQLLMNGNVGFNNRTEEMNSNVPLASDTTFTFRFDNGQTVVETFTLGFANLNVTHPSSNPIDTAGESVEFITAPFSITVGDAHEYSPTGYPSGQLPTSNPTIQPVDVYSGTRTDSITTLVWKNVSEVTFVYHDQRVVSRSNTIVLGNAQLQVVPEPASGLFAAALALFAAIRNRRA